MIPRQQSLNTKNPYKRISTKAFSIKALLIKKIMITLFFTLFLVSCGGSKDEVLETPPPTTSYDNSLKVFSEFEGRSVTLTSTLESATYQWEQTSGLTFDISSSNSQQLTLELPWISDGPLIAEFNVTTTIDNQSVTQPINLRILNRGFIILQVRNETSTNLFINYVSENDQDGVPELNTIQLTAVTEGNKVCGFSTSPNGRYVAYTSSTNDDSSSLNCGGLRVVDIESQVVQNITPLDSQGEPVKLRRYSWAPDSLQMLYVGDHGEDIDQIYVARVYSETVSYINFGDYSSPNNEWPSEDLFPIGDGGNTENSALVNDHDIGSVFWLSDDNGIAFDLYNHESGDRHPYQASSHGDAQILERNTLVVADLFESEQDDLDDDLFDCPVGGICTIIPLDPLRLTPITRQFTNPEWMDSSVDGQLAQIITMTTSNAAVMKVLSVRKPVIDGETILEGTPIEATEVIKAAWSPVDSSLAFSSSSNYRHRHAQVDTFDEAQQLIGNEVPDQLYWYQNYQAGHEDGQERLSRPQNSIDANPVREIKWPNDGQSIAYARGEDPLEIGDYFTSLWITLLDDVYDESPATIDANTVLLDATETGSYYSDYAWSPNTEGVIAIFQSADYMRIRYFNRDGNMQFESPDLLGTIDTSQFWLLGASFSPSGEHFAYLDKYNAGGNELYSAIYIYEIASGERVRIETPDLETSGIIDSNIQWSPHGDAILYSVRPTNTSDKVFYLASVNNEHENLALFINTEEQIIMARVDDFVGITNFLLGPFN